MTLLRTVLVVLGLSASVALVLWSPASRRGVNATHRIRYWAMVGANEAESHTIQTFRDAHPDISLEFTPIPWTEHEKKILTAVLSGDPPDVISQFAPVVQWASRMALQPLDDYIRDSQLDTSVFFPALMEEMQWQDRIFALPVFTASYAFFYNRELFREAGLDPDHPPTTWDEVVSMGKKLDRYDSRGRLVRAGFLPSFNRMQNVVLGNAGAAQLMAWQLGADYLDQDGRTVHLNTPEVAQALNWTRRFYEDYDLNQVAAFIGGLGTQDQHGFLTGKLGMAILDMSFLGEIHKYRPELDFGVAPTPSFAGGEPASVAGSWWLGIPRGAKNPDGAWEFIKHYVQASTLLDESLSRDDALFPANRLAARDPRFIRSPHTRVFIDQMEHSYSPVVIPLAHSVFWREFYGALERAVAGTQSVEASLRQAEQVVQEANTRASGYDTYVRSRMRFDESH